MDQVHVYVVGLQAPKAAFDGAHHVFVAQVLASHFSGDEELERSVAL